MAITKTVTITKGSSDVESPAVWTIKNGGTEATTITLENATTARTLVWANILAADYWLKIDGETHNCYTSSDSGSNWTRANGAVTGAYPTLFGGCANTINVTGITSSTDAALHVAVEPLGY